VGWRDDPVYLVGWRDDPRLFLLVGNLDCNISDQSLASEKDFKHAFVYLAAYYSDNHMNTVYESVIPL
jgi:hypothetical protein